MGQETEMSGSSNSNNVIRLPSIHTLANKAIDVNNKNYNNDKNSSKKRSNLKKYYTFNILI